MASLEPNEIIPIFKNRSGQGGWGNAEFEAIVLQIVGGMASDDLALDGSNSMSGAINTELGQFNSTSLASLTNAPFKLDSDSSVFPPAGGITGTRLAEILDSNGFGLIVERGDGDFGAGALVFNSNNTTLFTDMIFRTNAIAARTLFLDSFTNGFMGFRSGGSGIISSTSNMIFELNGNASTVTLNTANLRPTNAALDLGTSVRRWGNLFLSGSIDHTGTTAGFFSSTPVAQPTSLTVSDGNVPNSGDAVTNAIIANLQTRVDEVETKLQSLGLLA